MAEVQIRNILVGAGYMYTSDPRNRGDDSQELPDPWTEDGPRSDIDDDAEWRFVGATQDGVEIAYTPDTGEVEVDQQKTPALVWNTGLNVTMNTNLAEASLENLALSWGLDETEIAEDNDTLTFSFGTPGDFYSERSIAVVGNAPATSEGDQRERVYLARRVISAEGSTHSLSRTENVAFDVSFRLLEDPAYPGSEFGEILDVVPPEPA